MFRLERLGKIAKPWFHSLFHETLEKMLFFCKFQEKKLQNCWTF